MFLVSGVTTRRIAAGVFEGRAHRLSGGDDGHLCLQNAAIAVIMQS
jgi:hypothetical protein